MQRLERVRISAGWVSMRLLGDADSVRLRVVEWRKDTTLLKTLQVVSVSTSAFISCDIRDISRDIRDIRGISCDTCDVHGISCDVV